jgi:motility quorum-sensing regulator/GCU-specific mRNA interferase toxin
MVPYFSGRMEKLKPTHSLEAFQAAFATAEGLVATTVALRDAVALGFEKAEIVDVIQSMTRRHFYKSMTSFADHREWQDVYHVPYAGLVIYLKFTERALTGFQLLSFKEK